MRDDRLPPKLELCQPSAADGVDLRDDEALMELASGGHLPAFEALARRYLPRVGAYCNKLLGSQRAGEDLAQEVLFEVWSQRERYRVQGRFQVYLFTLARNRCLNALRAEGRRRRWMAPPSTREGAAPPDAAASLPDSLDQLLERERQRRVRDGLLRLPVRLREAVLMRFDQGLEYSEIAGIVGRPEATIRSRVFHGLKRLRSQLEQEESP